MRKKYFYKISSVILEIVFELESYEMIVDFLNRDFKIFKVHKCEKPDIKIIVSDKTIVFPRETIKLSNNMFSYNDKLTIKYSSTFRENWVTYSTKPKLTNTIEINLTKNYLKRNLTEFCFRCITPNYLFRWQNSLLDIFHGPILGVLQIKLMEKGASLLHSSSVANINEEGVVFAGWAQSGKSTIVDRLVMKKKWKFISEDICIITSENKIIGFPKQRRFYASQLRETKYYTSTKTKAEKIFEKLNMILFKKMKSFKSTRVLAIEEIFDYEQVIKESNMNIAIFIIRGNFNKLNLKPINNKLMASMCTEMMFYEMQNFNGFYQLLSAYGVISGDSNLLETITSTLKQEYVKKFKSARCFIMEIPEVEELDYVEKILHNKIEDILVKR